MQVVRLQAAGFGLLILLTWANEVFDLPHWLTGVPASSVNWAESIIETVVVALVGAATCASTWRAAARIRYLEGILRVCGYCKRIHVDGRWVAPDVCIAEQSEALCSHGICPDCLREHHAEFADRLT
jgi:hypothetical protein